MHRWSARCAASAAENHSPEFLAEPVGGFGIAFVAETLGQGKELFLLLSLRPR
jgi:hypothetical protein